MATDHIVIIVDDDRRIRESLRDLLWSFDLQSVAFESAAAYLEYAVPDAPACLILDVALPDLSGLELQERLGSGRHPPIVFVTGHGDIPSSVRAIKAGAVDFLTKPFNALDLMRAVNAALALDRETRSRAAELEALRARFATLTPRERDVLQLIASGLLNKQAAAELGISEVTLQIHRGHMMRKMAADSLAELVRMAGTLRVPVLHSRSRRD